MQKQQANKQIALISWDLATNIISIQDNIQLQKAEKQ